MVWRNDITLGREKEGEPASMSARQGALDREEMWGKAVRQAWAKAGQRSSVWESEEGTFKDGQRVGSFTSGGFQ